MNTLMNTEPKKKIWGIEYTEIVSDDCLIWRAIIKNPFYREDNYTVGINEKFLREAVKNGVNKILLVIGQREEWMQVPNEKELKRKDKAREYEMKESMFTGSPPMKIYHFVINN